MLRHTLLGALALASMAPAAMADIIFVSQTRTISVETAADGNVSSLSASNFAAFNAAVESDTGFTDQNGIFRRNRGRSSISCFIDFNAITAVGGFITQGGTRPGTGGGDEDIFGEAEFLLDITFIVTTPTQFQALGSNLDLRRRATDEFELELANLTTGDSVFEYNESNPINSINRDGILNPGTYQLVYHVETSTIGDEFIGDYDFALNLPAPGAAGTVLGGLAMLARRRR